MTGESRAVPNAWPDLAGRIEGREHVLAVRVYYEDTDFSGIVYHANYLKYCERGRSDFLRLLGVHHAALFDAEHAHERRGFAVARMDTTFHAPARIDDVLEVRTRFTSLGGARFGLHQEVAREGTLLFSADLVAAVIDGNGRPQRLPDEMRTLFGRFVQG